MIYHNRLETLLYLIVALSPAIILTLFMNPPDGLKELACGGLIYITGEFANLMKSFEMIALVNVGRLRNHFDITPQVWYFSRVTVVSHVRTPYGISSFSWEPLFITTPSVSTYCSPWQTAQLDFGLKSCTDSKNVLILIKTTAHRSSSELLLLSTESQIRNPAIF